MEKSEARKQENQRHRRESTSESESTGRKNSYKKNYKNRRSVDVSSDRDEKSSAVNSRKNSHRDTDQEDSAESTKENTSNNKDSIAVKEESRSDETVITKTPRSNAPVLRVTLKKEGVELSDEDAEKKEDDDDDDDEDDDEDKDERVPVKSEGLSPRKISTAGETDSDEGETDSVTVVAPKGRQIRKKAVRTRMPNNTRGRVSKPGPKARVTPKSKTQRGKK